MLLQSEGENPIERLPEIVVCMNGDSSTIHFPLRGRRNVKLCTIETPLIKLIWAFILKAFWEIELVQFKYKSHPKVISKEP